MDLINRKFSSSDKEFLKWKNNFSWSYNGDVKDGIKERIKRAGCNVEGSILISYDEFLKMTFRHFAVCDSQEKVTHEIN